MVNITSQRLTFALFMFEVFILWSVNIYVFKKKLSENRFEKLKQRCIITKLGKNTSSKSNCMSRFLWLKIFIICLVSMRKCVYVPSSTIINQTNQMVYIMPEIAPKWQCGLNIFCSSKYFCSPASKISFWCPLSGGGTRADDGNMKCMQLAPNACTCTFKLPQLEMGDPEKIYQNIVHLRQIYKINVYSFSWSLMKPQLLIQSLSGKSN